LYPAIGKKYGQPAANNISVAVAMDSFDEKAEKLKAVVRSAGSLLVSFSGGVDSAVLAAVAKEVLADRMVCAIIDSPLIPRCELKAALELVESLSIPCHVLISGITGNEAFLRNDRDRCYICKKGMAEILLAEAGRLGLKKVADGSNISDLSKFRPGFRAAEEVGIIHPFIDAGMDKEEIRRLARVYSLPVSGKPSASCLASRIPYGTPIGMEALGQIEASEEFVRSIVHGQVRVRKHGDVARIGRTR